MSARLVFLVTDGRFVTISRDLNADTAATLAAVQAQGLRGWIAEMSGSAYSKCRPNLVRREAVGGHDDEWESAIDAMHRRHLRAVGDRG
jgi:hypothetical protein